VVAESRLHRVADLPDRLRKHRRVELGHHLPAPELAQVAALRARARVVGVRLGHRREVRAAVELLLDLLRLR
jgi:hypothetical protein